jgi:cold shock protein
MRGQIVRLVRERGFGFLRTESGQEVFFHRTELQEASFDALRGDEQVEYDMGTDARSGRERAVNVRVAG